MEGDDVRSQVCNCHVRNRQVCDRQVRNRQVCNRQVSNRKVVISLLVVGATISAWASPAAAFWQFAANGPNGERQISAHYGSLKECNRALKLTEARLAKKYPELYPLVGSCEEYR
jgi:hypothetical protein